MSETKTEELIIGEAEVKQIAEAVTKELQPEIKETAKIAAEEAMKNLDSTASVEAVTKAASEAVEAAIEKLETTIKKNVSDSQEATLLSKAIDEGAVDKDVASLSPAMRFYRGMRALTADTQDLGELRKINAFTILSQKQARADVAAKGQEFVAKAGYANETTAADGAVLIPDAEFVTTVYDNLPNYGVAFANADVRQTDRTTVRVISLDSGLVFYATAEAGVKTSAKLAFAKNESTLAKYAVIVPATDELTEDAAIDYWNVVTREMSRAYAKLVDEITFTNATSGITNQTGVLTHSIGAVDGVITWDDLLTAQGKTEDDLDESNHKWYMRKETWFTLIRTKGTTNDHYISGSIAAWQPNPSSPSTPWGVPVVFTRVLPTINSITGSDGLAVYGDLRNYIVYNKRGMALTVSSEATITDSESASFNLFTQDATAMRAVVRVLGILPKGNRTKFVVLGTVNVS